MSFRLTTLRRVEPYKASIEAGFSTTAETMGAVLGLMLIPHPFALLLSQLKQGLD